MKIKIVLYIISLILGFLGIMLALGLIYLDQIDSGLPSRFFWVLDGVFLVLGTLSFSLARILAIWEEEDDESE